MNDRLRVYVRVKPLIGQNSIIDIIDDKTIIFDPVDTENQPNDIYVHYGEQPRSIGQRKNKKSNYTFDAVFDDRSSNYNIFQTVTKPMVDAVIDGYNCSVFAYGATGSGKTYTMLGKDNESGVIYHIARDLFEKLSVIAQQDRSPPQLNICYFEIYNEKVRDLLALEPNNFIRCGNKRLRTTPDRCRSRQQRTLRDASNLPVCEASGDGHSLVIPHLIYHRPENADRLIDLLEAGNANRSQHPTDANADSSRSHAIFQILLTRKTPRLNANYNPTGPQYELQTSKMCLIDLAGSERASDAYRPGNDRSENLQREGAYINKSLLALGNCINALADPKSTHKHIPYRNSKLTRLLEDSLGGKCRTAMIATVCQQADHYDETQNTLTYASRANCIKTRPEKNFTRKATQACGRHHIVQEPNEELTALQTQNEQLKRENDRLRLQVQSRPERNITPNASQACGWHLIIQEQAEEITALQSRIDELQRNSDRSRQMFPASRISETSTNSQQNSNTSDQSRDSGFLIAVSPQHHDRETSDETGRASTVGSSPTAAGTSESANNSQGSSLEQPSASSNLAPRGRIVLSAIDYLRKSVLSSNPQTPNLFLTPPEFDRTIPGGEGRNRPASDYDGCPLGIQDRLSKIINYNTRKRLRFFVEFEILETQVRASRGWIDFEVLQRLEPSHITVDYIRSVYLFDIRAFKVLMKAANGNRQGDLMELYISQACKVERANYDLRSKHERDRKSYWKNHRAV